MPLFNYRCPAGHVTESLRPRDVDLISCPCGEPAARESVYHISYTGFAHVPRDQRPVRMGEFLEASAEVEHAQSKVTDIEGRPVAAPSLWKAAKHEAARLQGLGVKDSSELR